MCLLTFNYKSYVKRVLFFSQFVNYFEKLGENEYQALTNVEHKYTL